MVGGVERIEVQRWAGSVGGCEMGRRGDLVALNRLSGKVLLRR